MDKACITGHPFGSLAVKNLLSFFHDNHPFTQVGDGMHIVGHQDNGT